MLRQFLVSFLALNMFAWFMNPEPAQAQQQPRPGTQGAPPPGQYQAPPPQGYQPAPQPGAPQGGPPPQAQQQPPGDPMAQIEAARRSLQQNRPLQAADALDEAVAAIYAQLGQRYAQTLPPPPNGWTVAQGDPQRAAQIGAAAIREYRQTGGAQGAGQGQMNARIVLDSGAVQGMQALFAPQMPQGVPNTVRKTKINNQDAIVAYDPQRKSGEVSMMVGNRILLQVEGQNVSGPEVMIAVMQQWNLVELRKLAGM